MQPPPLIPQGAAYFPVQVKAAPGQYAFLLLPDFTLSTFGNALDLFRNAYKLSHESLYHSGVATQHETPVVRLMRSRLS